MFLVFEASTKELGTTLKFWRCVLSCFVLFYDVLYYVLYYIMFYAGILYQQHSDSLQIVFSPFFTVGTCWNQARLWTNNWKPPTWYLRWLHWKPSWRLGELNVAAWARPGQAQINDRARHGSLIVTHCLDFGFMSFMWWCMWCLMIFVMLDDAWCLRNHSLNCYIRCSSL